MVGALGSFLFCGAYLLMLILGIGQIILIVMACIEAANGRFRPYPFGVSFLAPVDPYES